MRCEHNPDKVGAQTLNRLDIVPKSGLISAKIRPEARKSLRQGNVLLGGMAGWPYGSGTTQAQVMGQEI